MTKQIEVETITNTDGFIIPVKLKMENDEQVIDTYKIVGIKLRNRSPNRSLVYEAKVRIYGEVQFLLLLYDITDMIWHVNY